MEIDRLRYEINLVIFILIIIGLTIAICILYLNQIRLGMEVDRMQYDKPSRYSNKVLLGNWVEDQFHYKKDPQPIISSYREHYQPREQQSSWTDFVWDQKIKNEGLGSRILIDHGQEAYLDNMSALHDLSYNHFPKWLKGPIHRKWNLGKKTYYPNGEEYIINYGNITKYGILERKKEEWRCQKQDPRLTSLTTYQDMFPAPKREDLVTTHFAVPKANSSLRLESNFQSRALKLRNKFICNVVPNEQLVQVPEGYKCNPLTWECNRPDKPPPRKCIPVD